MNCYLSHITVHTVIQQFYHLISSTLHCCFCRNLSNSSLHVHTTYNYCYNYAYIHIACLELISNDKYVYYFLPIFFPSFLYSNLLQYVKYFAQTYSLVTSHICIPHLYVCKNHVQLDWSWTSVTLWVTAII